MKLLSVSVDAKTVKGEKQGYLTGILYLAPANLSGINVCANASEGCKNACLNTAGRAVIFPMIIEARIRKTKALFADRQSFIQQLSKDITALIRKASKNNLIPCVRINGTSDLPWLALELANRFPNVQFYDYTKHPEPWKRTQANYHLTFSNSETNLQNCFDALKHGINVAVIFPVKKGKALPTSWHNNKVIDGDISDLRFLYPIWKQRTGVDSYRNYGLIVALRAKGKARHDTSGFVQIAR